MLKSKRKPFKKFFIFFMANIFIFAMVLPVTAQPKVIVDGNSVNFDVPPVIDTGRTLVPLRAIFEALGANVEWDGTTKTVQASKDDTEIKLTIGEATAYVNNNPMKLDVPGKVLKGRTLVPLRFVGEGLGAEVVYDSDTKVITITLLTNNKEIDNETSKPEDIEQPTVDEQLPEPELEQQPDEQSQEDYNAEEIPSVKGFRTVPSLEIGKKLVVVELDTPYPQNYNVIIKDVQLTYNEQARKFVGDVLELQAKQSNVIVTRVR